LFLFLYTAAEDICAQQKYIISLNSLSARPMALGGAFFAVEDDIASVSYNPSTVSLYNIKRSGKLTVFINPVMPFAALGNPADFDYNENLSTGDVLNSFQYFITIISSFKAIAMGKKEFQAV